MTARIHSATIESAEHLQPIIGPVSSMPVNLGSVYIGSNRAVKEPYRKRVTHCVTSPLIGSRHQSSIGMAEIGENWS